jgi:regulator of RNase E activity RraA
MMEHKTFGVLPTNLKPLSDGMRVCGPAFTVKGMPDCRSEEEKKRTDEHDRQARMMEEMPENSVVVWDTSHDVDNAQFGEMMTAASMMRGSKGAVVDGGIRDTDRIRDRPIRVRQEGG